MKIQKIIKKLRVNFLNLDTIPAIYKQLLKEVGIKRENLFCGQLSVGYSQFIRMK